MTKKALYLGLAMIALGFAGGVFTTLRITKPTKSSIAFVNPDFNKLDLCDVQHVADGDTCTLKLPNGDVAKIRLVGVDTPETVDPRKEVQPYGPEASTHLKNLLQGERVWLESASKPDKYGRTLGYLYRYPDGLCINLEILRNGYGRYPTQYPCKYKEAFMAAAEKAKESHKGLYGNEEPKKPTKKKKP